MIEPRPIRFDVDTWLVMRNDKVIPKAVIQRVHHREGDRYLLFRWDLDPQKRELMNVVDSLERANDLVLYDNRKPEGHWSGAAERALCGRQFLEPTRKGSALKRLNQHGVAGGLKMNGRCPL